MLIQTIGAFFAVMTLAVLFSIPRKFLIYSGLVGAFGWLVYLAILYFGYKETTAVFVATLFVALISHTFARLFKAPVTVFLIPGIVPMVPGVGMYRIAYFMISDDGAMTSYYFNYTLQIAGLIAIAVFIMDTCFRVFQKNRH